MNWGIPGERQQDYDDDERRPLHFPIVRQPLPLKTVPPPKLLAIAITRHARALSARKQREREVQKGKELEAKKRLHMFAKLHLGRDDLPIEGVIFDGRAPWEGERRVAEDGLVVYSPRIG